MDKQHIQNVISNLQSARDRMQEGLPVYFGDGFDGDFDAMLEAINCLKALSHVHEA